MKAKSRGCGRSDAWDDTSGSATPVGGAAAFPSAMPAMFKDNGLSIVVFGLFLAAFIHRARDGRHARLQRRAGPTWRDARVLDRVRTLLGPGAIVLSIFLRQRGSAESKPVDAAHCETGKD